MNTDRCPEALWTVTDVIETYDARICRLERWRLITEGVWGALVIAIIALVCK